MISVRDLASAVDARVARAAPTRLLARFRAGSGGVKDSSEDVSVSGDAWRFLVSGLVGWAAADCLGVVGAFGAEATVFLGVVDASLAGVGTAGVTFLGCGGIGVMYGLEASAWQR